VRNARVDASQESLKERDIESESAGDVLNIICACQEGAMGQSIQSFAHLRAKLDCDRRDVGPHRYELYESRQL
jgi:hypothetical protein